VSAREGKGLCVRTELRRLLVAELAKIANTTTLAIMGLCSLSSGTWIAAGDTYQRAGVTTASGTATGRDLSSAQSGARSEVKASP
jgi:hypothetical protein